MIMMHVTIHTDRLEKSVEFYINNVGLSIQVDMRGKGGKNIVFLGNSPDEPHVELVEDTEEPYAGKGISIGFHTDDVNVLREQMARDGLDPSPMISPDPHVKFFFVKDPNGVDVQFVQ